jgi:hypothetical protein
MSIRTLLLSASLLTTFGAADAAPPRSKPGVGGEDLNRVSLEVQALQVLSRLELTARQTEVLADLATEAAVAGERRMAKAGDRLHKALVDLRTALRKGTDDDRIDELTLLVEELKGAEDVDLDDDVEISDASRERAEQLFRLLKPSQVADFLTDGDDEVHDPVDLILDTVRRKAKLTADEWKAAVKLTADEVGWLTAGVDKARAEKIRDKAADLLDRSARLGDAELEKAARHIVGDQPPTDVLRHAMTHALAELLSNPELPAALKGRTTASK